MAGTGKVGEIYGEKSWCYGVAEKWKRGYRSWEWVREVVAAGNGDKECGT